MYHTTRVQVTYTPSMVNSLRTSNLALVVFLGNTTILQILAQAISM